MQPKIPEKAHLSRSKLEAEASTTSCDAALSSGRLAGSETTLDELRLQLDKIFDELIDQDRADLLDAAARFLGTDPQGDDPLHLEGCDGS